MRNTCWLPKIDAKMDCKALSLFAGAGGMDIGVEDAGFKTVGALDIDRHCISTLRRNARLKCVWQSDIRLADPSQVGDELGLTSGGLALLHGGPPCQPFSQIGELEGVKDSRGGLVFEMVRCAECLRPTAVMIEQVPKFLQSPVGRDASMRDPMRPTTSTSHPQGTASGYPMCRRDCGCPKSLRFRQTFCNVLPARTPRNTDAFRVVIPH